MALFWRQGLRRDVDRRPVAAPGIARASLYGTFGSKHDLYVAALERYIQSEAERDRGVGHAGSGAADRRGLLRGSAAPTAAGAPPGCMVVNAAVECPADDVVVRRRLDLNWESVEVALTSALLRARAQREIRAEVDVASLARFPAGAHAGHPGGCPSPRAEPAGRGGGDPRPRRAAERSLIDVPQGCAEGALMTEIEIERSRKVRVPRWSTCCGATIFVLGTTNCDRRAAPRAGRRPARLVAPRRLLISAFAVAMAVGAPLLTIATLRPAPAGHPARRAPRSSVAGRCRRGGRRLHHAAGRPVGDRRGDRGVLGGGRRGRGQRRGPGVPGPRAVPAARRADHRPNVLGCRWVRCWASSWLAGDFWADWDRRPPWPVGCGSASPRRRAPGRTGRRARRAACVTSGGCGSRWAPRRSSSRMMGMSATLAPVVTEVAGLPSAWSRWR